MSLSLIVNSNNVQTDGLNTHFQYKFISGSLNVPENTEMCISNVTIPYSWFNLNLQVYNNTIFSYTFPSSSGQETFSVTIPNGNYSVNDINNYLQTVMITNGQYLVTSAGLYVYYITLAYDSTFYAVQLVTYAVPTSLPTGYLNPSGMTFPTVASTPQLVISSSYNFGSIIGFTSGTYPSTVETSNVSTLSNTVPNGAPVNALIMRCNLIDNNVTMPSDIVDSIPINAVFGANITYQPTFPKWLKVRAGRYAFMNISLVDQNLNAIQAVDSNLLITLLLKFPSAINTTGK